MLLTLVDCPTKNTACLPPTPKYDISLFKLRGTAEGRTYPEWSLIPKLDKKRNSRSC